jgi:hypothetical protein
MIGARNQIEIVALELAGICGDLRGLGTAVPSIDLLEIFTPIAEISLPPAA